MSTPVPSSPLSVWTRVSARVAREYSELAAQSFLDAGCEGVQIEDVRLEDRGEDAALPPSAVSGSRHAGVAALRRWAFRPGCGATFSRCSAGTNGVGDGHPERQFLKSTSLKFLFDLFQSRQETIRHSESVYQKYGKAAPCHSEGSFAT